jgi:hypothetical protein
VGLCDNPELLWDNTKSEVIVDTTLRKPPPLENLGTLLCILLDEAPVYAVHSVCTITHLVRTLSIDDYLQENCYFFCAAIYENLVALGGVQNTEGVPSALSMSFAWAVRERIKTRMRRSVTTLQYDPDGNVID